MEFVVFQCIDSPDYFIVTDDHHFDEVKRSICPGGQVKLIGNFPDLGEARAAFDESIARSAIRKQGYYGFSVPSMVAVPPSPEMP